MKFKLPKIKIFKPILSLKYLYFFVALVITAAAIILIVFLYFNFYQTITQSQQIILLKQEVSPDTINSKKVNNILGLLDKKATSTDGIDWQTIKNPFYLAVVAAPNPPAVK